MVTPSHLTKLIKLLTGLAVTSTGLFVVLVLFAYQLENDEQSRSQSNRNTSLVLAKNEKPAPVILHKQGEDLFKNNCASCHNIDSDKIGPALKGVASRRDIRWIRSFVRGSGAMIKSGDKTAVQLYTKYQQDMPGFSSFKEAEIDSIIAYIGEAGR